MRDVSVKLIVEGMSCDGCEQTVENAVTSVSGVRRATVDRTTNQVIVEGEDLDETTLVRAVEDAGYTAYSLAHLIG